MTGTTSRLPDRRLLLVLQITCALSAIAALPADRVHPVWLLAFILPAALLRFFETCGISAVWRRFAIAVAFQALTTWLTYRFLGPLDRGSALACVLLPFLTYFTLRREPQDTRLSLFLSFCFLLIGITLNDDTANWTLLVYLCSCGWAMQIEASNRAMLQRHATRGKNMSLASRVLRRVQVVAGLIMIAFLVYEGIGLLPSPTHALGRRQTSPTTTHRGRALGLNTRFDLRGGEGSPLNLNADEILLAEEPNGRTTPSDLYLRMTYFDRAMVDEWKTWFPGSKEENVDRRHGFPLREAVPGFQVHELSIKRLEPATEGEVFFPPATIRVGGIRRMIHNRNIGFYRSTDPRDSGYWVTYQRPHKTRLAQPIQPALANPRRFTALPAALKTPEMLALARELAGPRPGDRLPMDLARHIARGLQERCSYELREPVGPYEDSVHNFLFGSHKGYCMHFATALAIMLRLHHVPCRIAVGFHAGQSGPNGSRIFGSQHAHAWVEIPLQTWDWTLVDPTPPADRARRGWPNRSRGAAAGSGPKATVDPTPSSCLLSSLRDPLANPGAFLVLTFVVVSVSLGLILLVVRTGRRRRDGSGNAKPTPDSMRARRMLEQILDGLSRRGFPKHYRATLEQYLGALDGTEEIDVDALDGAFRAYQDIRFGGYGLDAEREATMLTGVALARER